ncbi:RNase H domain-containing protein [Trichonephila clavipes]|nr:RNase H domain-containing protein [Trichonephila clavipes]
MTQLLNEIVPETSAAANETTLDEHVPIVNSFTVWKMCEGLDQKTKFVLLQDWQPCIEFHTERKYLCNDRADQLAKEATCQAMNLLMSVPLSHWKNVAWERTDSSWNTKFLASPKALWTKRFFPTIYRRLQCKKFVTDFKLSQILTGHRNFNSYLSRFNLIGSDICSCGQDAETVEHVLLYCKLYFCKRENFKKDLKHA